MHIFFIFSVLVATAFATDSVWPENYYGIDISQGYSTGALNCLVGENLLFAVVRCYQSIGRPDPNCASTVANAHAAGMRVLKPCLYLFSPYKGR